MEKIKSTLSFKKPFPVYNFGKFHFAPRFICVSILLFFFNSIFAQHKTIQQPLLKGTVKIVFQNVYDNNSIILDDSNYTNQWGENFSIRKLKYYVSHCSLTSPVKKISNPNIHLINQSDEQSMSFSFNLPENNYREVSFLLGVDSIHNVSGAQKGALDPLNDMFWTWNTGYVMFKLEGYSPQSNALNNKIEYHIGGYTGTNSVLKKITLAMPNERVLKIKNGQTSIVFIEVDLHKFWSGPTSIKIGEKPVCSSEGSWAKSIAENFTQMFSIKKISNPE